VQRQRHSVVPSLIGLRRGKREKHRRQSVPRSCSSLSLTPFSRSGSGRMEKRGQRPRSRGQEKTYELLSFLTTDSRSLTSRCHGTANLEVLLSFNHKLCFNRKECRGITLLEVIFVLSLLCFLAILLFPALTSAREKSRLQTCQNRLRTLTLALRQYHDVHQTLPAAAVWNPDVTESLALHRSRRIELVTQTNWAICLLPYHHSPGQKNVGFSGTAIGDPENASLREMRLAAMTCPSDNWNRSRNSFEIDQPGGASPLRFARGNFAINGGTHHFETDPPSTSSPHGDALHLLMVPEPRQYAMWGNGIAGINKSFSFSDFVNGQATCVALEEVRAGIHPLDPRGVWALGQIGSSMTWGHGVNGDDVGPNQQWIRADDIQNCEKLHADPGTAELIRLRMPCVDYVDVNQQATSRSQHAGGVNVSFVDGSVRFLSDAIDSGFWHVLHSRETPPRVLADRLDPLPQTKWMPPQTIEVPMADEEETITPEQAWPDQLTNTQGMHFVRIPRGIFTMGLPDADNQTPLPLECPPHEVKLTHDYWLATHEVTRAQFFKIMNSETPPTEMSFHLEEPDSALFTDPADPADPTDPTESADLWPITGITWEQAVRCCELLSQLPEERAAGRAYRLPTEAEWEHACRTGSRTRHAHQVERQPADQSGSAAGMLPPLPLRAVGSFPPNAWRLYDMRGNAWEWTADWYARDYYARSPRNHPAGPARGDFKVVRGSDWRFTGETCHIDTAVLPPWKGNPVVGFRMICHSPR